MHSSNVSTHGMAVAPHHLASQSALAILREGGSAIEAMVAAAAAIAVVYPHMNGLGGDGFWLIVPPEGDPIAIDASGAAGSLATLEAYAGQRHIPHRGPQAALTVAGTVSGWDEALRISRDLTGRALPVARLLADAIGYAEDGIPVTASQAHATASKLEELRHQPGFSETWLVAGEAARPAAAFASPPSPVPCACWPATVSTAFIAGRWPSVSRRVWPRWGCLSPSATCRPTAPGVRRR